MLVTVERLAYGGQGIAHAQGLAIFVRDSAPGETVRVRVRRVFRRHLEADPVAIASPSPDRVAPRCRHVSDACGGCIWQHVSYPAQLAAKADAVRDSLERLGGFRDLPLRPILAAPDEFRYRNKMEFAFHPGGILGLHPREAWYEIISLRECLLAPPLMMSIVQAARQFVEAHGLSLYDPRTRRGLLRDLCVRHSRSTGEVLLGLVTGPGGFPDAEAMAAHLAAVDPCIKGVVRSIQHAPDGAAPVSETELLFGQDQAEKTDAAIDVHDLRASHVTSQDPDHLDQVLGLR